MKETDGRKGFLKFQWDPKGKGASAENVTWTGSTKSNTDINMASLHDWVISCCIQWNPRKAHSFPDKSMDGELLGSLTCRLCSTKPSHWGEGASLLWMLAFALKEKMCGKSLLWLKINSGHCPFRCIFKESMYLQNDCFCKAEFLGGGTES